jgi:hypothetical protein
MGEHETSRIKVGDRVERLDGDNDSTQGREGIWGTVQSVSDPTEVEGAGLCVRLVLAWDDGQTNQVILPCVGEG